MEAKKEKFLELLYLNMGYMSKTCQKMNITRQTVFYWAQKDEEFKSALEDVEESLIDYTESKLFELIKDKNPTAIIFHLKTKGKKRGYVERNEFEHNLREGINVNIKSNWNPGDNNEP